MYPINDDVLSQRVCLLSNNLIKEDKQRQLMRLWKSMGVGVGELMILCRTLAVLGLNEDKKHHLF